MQKFIINQQTKIKANGQPTPAIENAINILNRDIQMTTLASKAIEDLTEIRVNEPNASLFSHDEQFSISFQNPQTLTVDGSDELGLVYGLLYISQQYLGVDPFWYWADMTFEKQSSIAVAMQDYKSEPFAIKYRGWFVNDEVCLIGWKKELGYPPTKEVWFPVFETLLRLGGNMVLPGTDLPEGIQEDLAADFGLYLTHHHAEPLGAEMFKRAYPDKQASFKEHRDLYIKLWKEAIERQKDKKVIWALSFRGQGDAPFWQTDPEFDTPEKQGKQISEVMAIQYQLIKEAVPDAICSVNLYGEISELYKDGHITLPPNVIKIWADNGYGKMVSRRNGNVDKRISSLPENKGKEGVYYHITFHDLQASNHLTMFPNHPDLIQEAFKDIFANNGKDYLLLNVGNIKMHSYFIDLVANIWRNKEVKIQEQLEDFTQRLFPTQAEAVANLLNAFHQGSFKFGTEEDQKAGEQIYFFTARRLIAHLMSDKKNQPLDRLYWLTGQVSLLEQVALIKNECQAIIPQLEQLKAMKTDIENALVADEKVRFTDLIGYQVDLLYFAACGLESLMTAMELHDQEETAKAFVHASKSLWFFQDSLKAWKVGEHDKWEGFYSADWLTNIELTVHNLSLYRSYLRIQGDQVVYFNWYKKYLMPETEKHIYLENTHRNPLSDDVLALKLQEYFEIQ